MVEASVLQSVFTDYPACWRPVRLARVTCRAGFSGGVVWKAETEAGPAAVRQWTPGYSAARLGVLHRLLRQARQAGCDVIPEPIATTPGRTYRQLAGHLWELCTWMPGRPHHDVDGPVDDRLAAAVRALARWHQSIRPEDLSTPDTETLADPPIAAAFRSSGRSPSPGMARRRSEWIRLSAACEPDLPPAINDARGLASRTCELARRRSADMRTWIVDADQPVSLRVCLRDVHREHVLFTGNAVTGLVDFGACGIDTPACDLGRLLGSLVPDDPDRWRKALAWYREISPLCEADAELAWRFDRTGTVIGALHWLEWLVLRPRRFADPDAAYARWNLLVERIERWSGQREPE